MNGTHHVPEKVGIAFPSIVKKKKASDSHFTPLRCAPLIPYPRRHHQPHRGSHLAYRQPIHQIRRCLIVQGTPQHRSGRLGTPLDSDPGNGNDDIHALLLGALPLVAEGAVLLVVPVGANGAVHAAAAVLLRF